MITCQINSHTCYRTFRTHENAAINCAVLHPNQTDLFISDQLGCVYIWNLRSDKYDKLCPDMNVHMQWVSVHPEGRFLAGVTTKGDCHIWSLKSGVIPEEDPNGVPRVVATANNYIPAHKRYALKCRFSPDGKLLATSSADQTVKLWSVPDFAFVKELHLKKQKWVWDVAFSNDSKYLFTATSDNNARLWSIADGTVKREYIGHQKPLTALAFRDGVHK